MPEFSISQMIALINTFALIYYFIVLGIGLNSMQRRVRTHRAAQTPVGILLKRAIALYLGLASFGGIILIVRVTGAVFEPDSFERLLFVLLTVFSLLGPLTYYTKAEVFDLDNPEVP